MAIVANYIIKSQDSKLCNWSTILNTSMDHSTCEQVVSELILFMQFLGMNPAWVMFQLSCTLLYGLSGMYFSQYWHPGTVGVPFLLDQRQNINNSNNYIRGKVGELSVLM